MSKSFPTIANPGPRRTTSHRAPLRALLAAAVAAAALSASASRAETKTDALEEPAVALRHTYDFYLGGVPIAEARLTARIGKLAYSAKTRVRTIGLLKSLVTVKVDSRTQGVRPETAAATDALTPGVFQMSSKVRDKKFDMRMAFAGDAPAEVSAEPKFKKKKYEIDPAAQRGALDPISAVLTAFLPAASGDVCNRSIPVFDGRRRFNVVFAGRQKEYVEKGRKYVECKGVFERVGGFSPKMMDQRLFPFYAQFRLNEDGSPTATRLWGQTDFGVAMAFLRQ